MIPGRIGQHSVGAAFRLLLAYNPKLAPLPEAAGFDLHLSGHTHAGQFFPWTLAVHLVHTPHVAGLSRSGRMWVDVSAATGAWGPPMRFDSEPELTLVRLMRADKSPLVAKRPGGNVTGLGAFATDLGPKRVQLITQIPVVRNTAGAV